MIIQPPCLFDGRSPTLQGLSLPSGLIIVTSFRVATSSCLLFLFEFFAAVVAGMVITNARTRTARKDNRIMTLRRCLRSSVIITCERPIPLFSGPTSRTSSASASITCTPTGKEAFPSSMSPLTTVLFSSTPEESVLIVIGAGPLALSATASALVTSPVWFVPSFSSSFSANIS